MKIEILKWQNDKDILSQVVDLADKNSKTLGFMPEVVFQEQAKKRNILVAVDDNKELAGYISFRVNKQIVHIIHFCVNDKCRGKGVAEKLFEQFRRDTRGCFGVKLHCLKNNPLYEYADALWKRLGFIEAAEKKGRSKKGSILTVWWLDYERPNLFTRNQPSESDIFKVVIDMNIIYDILRKDDEYLPSQALLADWLDIELCVTDEAWKEIIRNKDQNEQNAARLFIENHFDVLQSYSEPNLELNLQELYEIFQKNKKTDNLISDLNHIAKTAAASINFFITRDEDLLKKANLILDKLNVEVLDPTGFIQRFDELNEKHKYEPIRFSGSKIHKKAISAGDIKKLTENFSYGQKKTEVLGLLRNNLLDPHISGGEWFYEDDQNILAAFVWVEAGKKLRIPFLRNSSSEIAKTLSKSIVKKIVLMCLKRGANIIEIEEKELSNEFLVALDEAYFFERNIKICFSGLKDYSEVTSQLKVLNINSINSRLAVDNTNGDILYQMERFLYPLKIKDCEIPNFIVPIKPVWAAELFDEKAASVLLFPSKTELILNRENIYYCSYRHKNKFGEPPARILWYISSDKDGGDSQSINACSYLDAIEVGDVKKIYKKYKKLGVYDWESINNMVKGKKSQQILAFKFSDTFTLPKPILLAELKKIYKEIEKKDLNLQSPVRITTECFNFIYQKGS